MYLDNSENKKEVNHIDGDKKNNDVSNLEWCTHYENMKHAKNKGLIKSGFDARDSKFNYADLLKIKYLRDSGFSYRNIAKEMGISATNIRRIVRNETYIDCPIFKNYANK